LPIQEDMSLAHHRENCEVIRINKLSNPDFG